MLPAAMKQWLSSRWPAEYVWLRDRYRAFRRKTAVVMSPALSLIILPLRIAMYLPWAAAIALRLIRLRPSEKTTTGPGHPLQIVMLAISEVWRDPRVEREATALARAGYQVKILYPESFESMHSISLINWGAGITFKGIPAACCRYAYEFPYVFGFRFLFAALKEHPFAFHAHDLCTSLIALTAASMNRCRCVCDFHEWYSENVTWHPFRECYEPHAPITKAIYRWAEKYALEQATAVITVCDSIAAELDALSDRKQKVAVIRNIPMVRRENQVAHTNLRHLPGLEENQFLILYQGGTGPSRFLEPIIEALALAPQATLVIRGPEIEIYRKDYENLAMKMLVSRRLICLPPVPSGDVVAAAAGADVGIWTLPDLCKNFRYALPNKIFEYLAAGLPILIAKYPEPTRIAEDYGVGLTFDPYDPASIAAQINCLIQDRELHERLRKNIPAALSALRADVEWDKVVAVYQNMHTGTAERPLALDNFREQPLKNP